MNRLMYLTDRELVRLRRSSNTGSNLLFRVVCEEYKRGMLNLQYKGSGYCPEIYKNIRDVPDLISHRSPYIKIRMQDIAR